LSIAAWRVALVLFFPHVARSLLARDLRVDLRVFLAMRTRSRLALHLPLMNASVHTGTFQSV
jgi:hypothetical protein